MELQTHILTWLRPQTTLSTTKNFLHNCQVPTTVTVEMQGVRNKDTWQYKIDGDWKKSPNNIIEDQLLDLPINLKLRNTNRGISKPRGQFLENSNTKYILFLDDDILIQEGAIRKLLDTMKSNPNLGALTLNIPRVSAGNWINTETGYKKDEVAIKGLQQVEFMSMGATIIRTGLRIQHDPHYFVGWEDSDLCEQIKEVGHNLAVLENAQAARVDGTPLFKRYYKKIRYNLEAIKTSLNRFESKWFTLNNNYRQKILTQWKRTKNEKKYN